jgi:AraC family transcriptional activator of pobA
MRFDQHTAAGVVRSGLLDGSLRPRVVGLAESLAGPSWFAVLIETGVAHFSDVDTPISGPSLVWRPWGGGARVTFQAGTSGTYIILGPTALANAVGHMPETRELREMADRVVISALTPSSDDFLSLRAVFQGVGRELGSDGAAAHAVVEAYLRVILVEVFRAGKSQLEIRERPGASHRVFADYGALVEAHFRERWSVNDYSRALGVSRDRLGDICRRVRGLGPKELIDRRVALEARLQLENSSNSIQQIAGLLGFSSAAQFNRFFARTVGRPPGAYRDAFVRGGQLAVADPARPYDWP